MARRKISQAQARRWKKEAQYYADESLFYHLFFLNRLDELITEVDNSIIDNRDSGPTDDTWPWVRHRLLMLLNRAEDTEKCKDVCKSMYFCDEPLDHTGDHKTYYGLSWPKSKR